MVHIETRRLVLREYRQEDLPAHAWLMQNEDAMRYLQDIRCHSTAEATANLAAAMLEAAKPAQQRRQWFLAVAQADTGAYMGSVGYTVVDRPPPGAVVALGYFLLPEYHGQGVMTEALRALLGYAFHTGGVYRLNTGCLVENAASERVMQKCGLVREGYFPRRQWHEGKMKDRVAYRLLKEEWEAACESPTAVD